MIQFNPDGSIKLPENIAQRKKQDKDRMQNSRCLQITRELVSVRSPKSCNLLLHLSERVTDQRFIETIYHDWTRMSEVPAKLEQLNAKDFKVSIGTCFSRCSDCSNLIRRYKEFMDGNILEVRGGCEYGKARNFSYEDYFD